MMNRCECIVDNETIFNQHLVDNQLENCYESHFDLLGKYLSIIHGDVTCRDGNNTTGLGVVIRSTEGSVMATMHG